MRKGYGKKQESVRYLEAYKGEDHSGEFAGSIKYEKQIFFGTVRSVTIKEWRKKQVFIEERENLNLKA